MGGVRGTGDEMRDARLPVRVKNGGQGWGGVQVCNSGTKEAEKLRKGRRWRMAVETRQPFPFIFLNVSRYAALNLQKMPEQG